MTSRKTPAAPEEKGNVRSYLERSRCFRWCSEGDLFRSSKNGLRRWAADPLDFQLMFDADAEFKLRVQAIPFDEECRQLVEKGVALLSPRATPYLPACR